MHVDNCEYLLLTISCEMNADEYLFLVDLNERRGDNTNLVWLKALTHQTPPRRFCTFFFEVLPFTDDASIVNGKTSKKSVQKQRGGFWCVKTLIVSFLGS